LEREEVNLSGKNDYMEISMSAEAVSAWNYLLQKGFALETISGSSVRNFLRSALGFDDEFIDGTVRTIFLNNSPVDDLDDTFVKDGDRLALGGAMPGLVGIVMGRDNFYKSFRSGISVKDHVPAQAAPARLSVKVFSTLAVESGRNILGRGILVDAAVLAEFLDGKRGQIVEAGGMSADDFIAGLAGKTGDVAVRISFS
jgi:hypothetical protein